MWYIEKLYREIGRPNNFKKSLQFSKRKTSIKELKLDAKLIPIVLIAGHSLSRFAASTLLYTHDYVREDDDSKAKPAKGFTTFSQTSNRQAPAQWQAHLQLFFNGRKFLWLQKSLPFFPPHPP